VYRVALGQVIRLSVSFHRCSTFTAVLHGGSVSQPAVHKLCLRGGGLSSLLFCAVLFQVSFVTFFFTSTLELKCY
jgi:hypothetical protein